MNDHDPSELPGLYTAVQLVDEHLGQLNAAGGDDPTLSGEPDTDAGTVGHGDNDARHGALVGLRDALYERITELGGQWQPGTEVGDKQPPTPS